MGKYFGTDGFRGRANETLTAEHAFLVGKCLGSVFRQQKAGKKARIVVGKDTRRSSYTLEYALAAGITSAGADTYLLHVTTTPSVAYVARTEGFDCGVMISASHNPFEDNGIKIINGRGEKADDVLISAVEEVLDGKLAVPLAKGEEIGRTIDYVAGRNRYTAYLTSVPLCSFRGYRVGLDCANGSAWAIGKAVFDALGAEVVQIGAQPNGCNVNDGCGSTHMERLQALVTEQKLDVGFAFDGDADRCLCVDERGKIVDGDGILYLLARDMGERGELTSGGVVCTVMSNGGLYRALKERGISCAQTCVGDRFVYEEMVRRESLLGGEQSGHVILRKYATTGDGLLTAVKVMETLVERKCPLSLLLEGFEKNVQVQKSVRVSDKQTILQTERVKQALFYAEKTLGYCGKVLVRASGTESVVRVLCEGNEFEACQKALDSIVAALQAEDEEE